MEFRRTVQVTAPVSQVWALVGDIPAVASCIPGLHDLKQNAPTEFECVVSQRVGSVKANFNLHTTMSDLEPEQSLTAVSKGRDEGLNSSVEATQRFVLSRNGDGTQVDIIAEFRVTGKIATFGQRIIAAKAEQVTVETLRNLSKLLEERNVAPSS